MSIVLISFLLVMKFTNSFLVSCRSISYYTSNLEMVLETMKRAMFSTKKLLHGRYVLDLFSNLCRKKIGTNAMVNQYRRICVGLPENRERQNEIKEDENLTEPQRRGIKGLVRRVKDNELVVFQTDESGCFSVDAPDNYRESVMPHVGDDPQISWGNI